ARPPEGGPPDESVVEVLRRHAGGRGLIVAGHGASFGGGPEPVLRLAEHLGWPVLADPRSGCRVPSPWVVSTADSLLRTARFARQVPEAVLRLGTPWASKAVNQWLAGLPTATPVILADPWGRWADPERTASHLTRTTAAALAGALGATPAGLGDRGGEWAGEWRQGGEAARAAIDRLIAPGGELDMTEPAVASAVLAALPPGGTLLASSSMPVRDVEWYGRPATGVRVLSNRGANGIDGVVSTALGVAMSRAGHPVSALVGDLAFLYDAGSLLWAGRRPADLRLVVVDNDGGGIFSFLPQASALPADRFERYWGTPHGLDLLAVAAAYGVPGQRVGTRAELDGFLSEEGSGVRLAVVPSGRPANVAAHDRIHADVAAAVGSEIAR
ncbi:MAG TPA: thiamine pyrophosphate-dependent enzyme, partial [Acidimicrobiales bacterium]|nr:thiamine pyrophosphate-dependent enzyme [Acidimicrobiales bacterium]